MEAGLAFSSSPGSMAISYPVQHLLPCCREHLPHPIPPPQMGCLGNGVGDPECLLEGAAGWQVPVSGPSGHQTLGLEPQPKSVKRKLGSFLPGSG